jgi:hypothetical protein
MSSIHLLLAALPPSYSVDDPSQLVAPLVPLYARWWFWLGCGFGSTVITAGIVTALWFLGAVFIGLP